MKEGNTMNLTSIKNTTVNFFIVVLLVVNTASSKRYSRPSGSGSSSKWGSGSSSKWGSGSSTSSWGSGSSSSSGSGSSSSSSLWDSYFESGGSFDSGSSSSFGSGSSSSFGSGSSGGTSSTSTGGGSKMGSGGTSGTSTSGGSKMGSSGTSSTSTSGSSKWGSSTSSSYRPIKSNGGGYAKTNGFGKYPNGGYGTGFSTGYFLSSSHYRHGHHYGNNYQSNSDTYEEEDLKYDEYFDRIENGCQVVGVDSYRAFDNNSSNSTWAGCSEEWRYDIRVLKDQTPFVSPPLEFYACDLGDTCATCQDELRGQNFDALTLEEFDFGNKEYLVDCYLPKNKTLVNETFDCINDECIFLSEKYASPSASTVTSILHWTKLLSSGIALSLFLF